MKVHRGTTRGSFGAAANAPRKREPTYYEVLGAPPGSSLEMLHSKFKELAVQWHPDKVQGAAALAHTLVLTSITEAYGVLKDTVRRKEYDARLALQGGACMFCQGKGLKTKQHSFAHRTTAECDRCNGSGRADGGLQGAQIWGR